MGGSLTVLFLFNHAWCQDLPNYLQDRVPIFSLPQEWLWCETWCDDESKARAKTIDLVHISSLPLLLFPFPLLLQRATTTTTTTLYRVSLSLSLCVCVCVLHIISFPPPPISRERFLTDGGLGGGGQCNNPLTKTPKLENAVRIIEEWRSLDEEIKSLERPTSPDDDTTVQQQQQQQVESSGLPGTALKDIII